jgi:hypothetical protein
MRVSRVSTKKYNITVRQMTQVRFVAVLLTLDFPSVAYIAEMHYKCLYVTNLSTLLSVIQKKHGVQCGTPSKFS